MRSRPAACDARAAGGLEVNRASVPQVNLTDGRVRRFNDAVARPMIVADWRTAQARISHRTGGDGIMKRWMFFAYGVACYAAVPGGRTPTSAASRATCSCRSRSTRPTSTPCGRGRGDQRAAAAGVRPAAFGHGPAGVQARVDAARAAADRAQHLRARLVRRARRCSMWQWRPIDGDRVGRAEPGRPRRAVDAVRRRLADGARR